MLTSFEKILLSLTDSKATIHDPINLFSTIKYMRDYWDSSHKSIREILKESRKCMFQIPKVEPSKEHIKACYQAKAKMVNLINNYQEIYPIKIISIGVDDVQVTGEKWNSNNSLSSAKCDQLKEQITDTLEWMCVRANVDTEISYSEATTGMLNAVRCTVVANTRGYKSRQGFFDDHL
jgi:hypothetical protein